MPTQHSRRQVLRYTALAASAASYSRIRGANDVIGIGVIGLGNISRGHLQEFGERPETRVTAVCDIYAPRLDAGVSKTGAKGYKNYRDLLGDSNVDAVIVCTPDHWHAPMAIDAMRAGKDVDVEKPMCMTVEEAKEMVRVSEETQRILSVDSEHMAHGIWEPARKAVADGVLGKVLWNQTSRSRNARQPPWNYPIDEGASEANIDWEAFLGNAPKVPFDKERFFRWRRYWDYSGGIATDLFYHHITPLIHVLGREFPIRAVGSGGNYFTPKQVQVPDTFVITLDFPGQYTLVCGGSLNNSVELPIVIRGNEANIHFHGGSQMRPDYILIEPEDPYRDDFKDKVVRSGLDKMGRWIEEKGEPRPTDFRGQPARRKNQLVQMLLAEPDWKGRYDEYVKKDPSIAKPGPSYDDYFQRLFEERAEKQAIQLKLRIDAPPTPTFRQYFIEAIRTRKPTPLDGHLGYRSQVAVALGVEAYRRNRVMFFDPAKEALSEHPVSG
ncbi:MAG: Gfo/Idh/MocA family oxidoreductase [Bryobacterales bacterium]